MSQSPPAPWTFLLGGVFVLLFAAGCHRQPRDVLYAVRGKITLDGKPLPRGSVTLRPETREAGHQPTGMIEPAGEYVVYTNRRAGAPPGSYKVVVFATEAAAGSAGSAHPGLPQSLVPVRYNRPEETPLRLKVVAKPATGVYNLELISHEK